jgi:hypothetical protein
VGLFLLGNPFSIARASAIERGDLVEKRPTPQVGISNLLMVINTFTTIGGCMALICKEYADGTTICKPCSIAKKEKTPRNKTKSLFKKT